MEKEKNRRNTPQRKLIRAILSDCHDHPTAESVYARARAIRPSIGFGTVYRNLSILADSGEILRLPIPGGADRFDGTVEGHGHYYCHECGAFGDIPEGVTAPCHAPEGFAVEGLLLIATGRCAACCAKE